MAAPGSLHAGIHFPLSTLYTGHYSLVAPTPIPRTESADHPV